jgi:hypothetical protein
MDWEKGKLSPNFIDRLVIIHYYKSMNNNSTLIKTIPYLVAAVATGSAAYALLKTYKTVKNLDDVLHSIFNGRKVNDEK